MRALVRQTSSDSVSVGKADIDWCMGSWGIGGCAAGIGNLFTVYAAASVCAGWSEIRRKCMIANTCVAGAAEGCVLGGDVSGGGVFLDASTGPANKF